ncbi:MAG: acetate--CoA ligase family protein [Nannocystis sp.]|uniref:acetate--CoA ligase family protein n=1 Tax=Nannocystis sp. TaxID=1962667 RepID=UPI0024215348|nr:acetate--CoA ligase family protein [Nannocystis sp.]MBK9754276.1 acetate--CoA ligase family protein [Nannocystis sp.]
MTPPATALQALLAPAATATLIAEAAAPHVRLPGELLRDAELARRVRDHGALVVVVHSLGPALLRALRERPPALLVVTGPAEPGSLPALPDTLLLGPDARLQIGPTGDTVACATAPAELAALLAALASASDLSSHLSQAPASTDLSPRTDHLSQAPALPAGVRLAACPTPPWWPLWLADPQLAGTRALGFVAAASLHPGWARWARAAGDAAEHAIVPLGLPPARLDLPRDPSLAAAVAAHALERFTGPLFPSPQLLALLCAPPAPVPEDSHDPGLLARWAQARRALPTLGAAVGMEAPLPGPGLAAPTAAFLAQAALLRRRQTRALLAAAPELAAPQQDPAAIARAEEVLRGAGQVLSEHESKVVLRGFGVEITRQAVASSASGAAQYADTIGYPVVLKAVSPDLRRKQELGAVVLGLTTSAAVRRAYATIVHNVETHAPTAHLDGVLVAEQAPEGLELHCGAIRLHTGEMAIFGRALGLSPPAEPCFALAPLAPADARLLAHAVLARVPALRRASDPGVAELAALLLRLDALVQHFDRDLSPGTSGRLISVELSPLRLIGPPRGYLTLDARIVQRAHLEGS